MSHQSEAILESNLIRQLISLGYESVKIHDGDVFVSNLIAQLETFASVVAVYSSIPQVAPHRRVAK